MKTYQEAVAILNGRECRKLKGNTWLERDCNFDLCIRLWNTIIITYFPNGIIKLNAAGYKPMLTKNRINEYTNARIFQREGTLYLSASEGIHPFGEGMIIFESGAPLLVGGLPEGRSAAPESINLDDILRHTKRLLNKR